MATTSFMIQLLTEEYYDPLVTEAYPIEEEAYLFLDPSKSTVIREIAFEQNGGIVASHFASALNVGFTNSPFTQVKLLPVKGETETILYAPSHVPSPPINGMALAILRVTETGVVVDDGAKLAVTRFIGAHAYVDQIEQ
jgi:hypothetical protein